MKLFELDATRQTKQAAKVFESYFGGTISFDSLNKKQARHMLTRVRSLIKEHRSQPSFHTSEQNPSYMKLVVMEQGLAAKLREADVAAGGVSTPADMQKQAAAMALQQQQRKKQIQDQIKQKQQELQMLQKQLTQPMSESRLTESEVQQAQVVLASQDMVDQVQKMIEQVTSMQFKDLPALVDQVKTQMGPDQAMKFNQEVTTALTGLTQNLQGSKTQLDAALGVVTGQAPVVPGEAPAGDLGAPAPAGDVGLDAELPPEGEEEVEVDAEIEEPGAEGELGRERR